MASTLLCKILFSFNYIFDVCIMYQIQTRYFIRFILDDCVFLEIGKKNLSSILQRVSCVPDEGIAKKMKKKNHDGFLKYPFWDTHGQAR